MQRRIQLARALLATGVPVIQAAADAGFADQSHLTRLFARTLGITPAVYSRAFA
jgi:AraC-like DNA-binding protein